MLSPFSKDKMTAFFASGATLPYEFRIAQLKKLKQALMHHQEALTEAVKQDFNKSYFETYMSEIMMVKDELDYFIKHLKKLMKPKRAATPIVHFKSSSKVFHEPYGLVLIISPWNYPVTLTLTPLVGAIAAGNCAVIKPSSKTTHTSDLIEKIVTETFDPEYVTVVQGSSDITHELIGQGFDYLVFTGSPRAAKDVAASAAPHLTPMTLELGGKSPTVVYADADMPKAAARVTWGKLVNGGQTCIAPDYILVEEEARDDFIAEMKRTITEFYGDDPLASDDLPSIINEKNYERLKGYLTQGEVVFGGTYRDADRKIAPTLLLRPDPDSPVMRQEIFGPILPILTFRTRDEVMGIIRDRPKPLAFYLFTKDRQKIDYYLEHVHFGNGCVNDTLIQFANTNIPFGGVGNSGMGQYHGRYSFETFSHVKGVSKKTNLFDIALRYPPYTEKNLKLLKMYIDKF